MFSNDSTEDKPEDPVTTKENDYDCIETNGLYERTFVTFENQQFYEFFKKKQNPRPTLRSLCAITRYKNKILYKFIPLFCTKIKIEFKFCRFPAKYRDPMTQLPYRNVQCFRPC